VVNIKLIDHVVLIVLLSAIPGAAWSAPTNFYVGGAGASDANSGLTPQTPWATITKLNSYVFPSESVIHQQGTLVGSLFLNGDKYKGNARNTTATTPIIYDGHGHLLRANTGGVNSYTVYLFWVRGFVFRNTVIRGNGMTNNGILISGQASGTVTGNDVGGFALDITNGGTGIYLHNTNGTISVTNNVVHGLDGPGSHDDFGILTNGAVGSVTINRNTVYNIGGFPKGASGYNGNGIEVTNSPKAKHMISQNLVHDIGGNANTCGGPSGILVYDSDSVTVNSNEVYNVRPIKYFAGCDWAGIDLDGGATNSQVIGNYTHNNFGPGLLAYMGNGRRGAWGPSTYKFNISENDAIGGINPTGNVYTGASMDFQNRGATKRRVLAYNNTIIQTNPMPDRNHRPKAISFTDGGPTSDSLIANNIFAFGSANLAFGCLGRANADWAGLWAGIRSGHVFRNNVYYALTANTRQVPTGDGSLCVTTGTLGSWVAMTGETNTMLLNPQVTVVSEFVGPVPVGTLVWNPVTVKTYWLPGPAGYKLAPTSGLLRAGVDPTLFGAPAGDNNFYGSAINPATGYNIGAY
jgi:hypothetical protein